VTDQAPVTAQGVYADASAPVIPRTRVHVTSFFDGLELAAPGVCDVSARHPEIPPARPHGQARPAGACIYGGVAAKR
jgi:hypothetical protein